MKRFGLAALRRLTAGGVDHDHPVFAPDGRWIVFAAGSYGATDLYLVDRRGRFARQLTTGLGQKTQPCFAPDGSRVAYCAQAELPLATDELGRSGSSAFEVFLLDLVPGAEPVRLLGTEKRADPRPSYKQPSFSPDGRRLAYFSDEGSPQNFHLFLLDLSTGARTQVTNEPLRNDCHPAFASDARRVAFHGYEGLEADRANIYVIDTAQGAVARVTDRPGLSKHPSFADDRTIVFHREEPEEEPALFAVDIEHGRETRLTPPGFPAKQPCVVRTRKGRWKIAFAARGQRKGEGESPLFDIFVATLRARPE